MGDGMKKTLLVILALILIVGGIYGLSAYSKIKQAKNHLNDAVLSLNESKHDEAIEKLKSIVAVYPQSMIKAPALYLLGTSYEKKGNYAAAGEVYRMLVTHKDIPVNNDWFILSIIAISKLYRNELLPLSKGSETTVFKYIHTVENAIRMKKDHISLSPILGWDETPFISLQNNLVSLKLDKEEILKYLKTELAFLYIEAERYREAAVIFSDLDTNAARFGMAQIYFELGYYRNGIELLKQLTAYDTTGKINQLYLEKSYRYAELLYNEEYFKEAVEIYNKIITLAPDSRYGELSSYKLAVHYYSQDDFNKAHRYADTTLTNSVHLKDEDSYLLKGYLYYDARDFVRALKIFDGFKERFPDSDNLQRAEEWKSMCERSVKYLG
jgi:tetratricopeptide (TPR) repeat protein